MIETKLYDADIYDIHPNSANRKFGFIVRCYDLKKDFFVKPSWSSHFHNENEFLAYSIASLIDAPMPDGKFLKISAENMQNWHNYVKEREHSFNEIFMPPYSSAVFFGAEILHAKHSSSIDSLKRSLSKSDNKNEFFSQFPLDQYIKNPDRHIGNYFFSLNRFFLIDFDRLFHGATDWSMLDDINDFDCFSAKGYNADLYEVVTSNDIKTLHGYAAQIEKITDDEIASILQTMSNVYPRTKPYLDKISKWIKSRRDLIYEKCLANEHCYSSVKQKGVFSVLHI